MKVKKLLLSCILVLLSSSCIERRLEYNVMIEIVAKADPEYRIIIPNEQYPVINCYEYGEGCLFGIHLKIKGIQVDFIRFKSQKDAIRAAIRFGGLYRNDWMIDDIKDEPYLEDFFIQKMQAQKPLVKWISGIPEGEKKWEAPSEEEIMKSMERTRALEEKKHESKPEEEGEKGKEKEKEKEKEKGKEKGKEKEGEKEKKH